MRRFALSPLWRQRWSDIAAALEACLAEEPIDEGLLLKLIERRQRMVAAGPSDLEPVSRLDQEAAREWLLEAIATERRISRVAAATHEVVAAARIAADRNAALSSRFEAAPDDEDLPVFIGRL